MHDRASAEPPANRSTPPDAPAGRRSIAAPLRFRRALVAALTVGAIAASCANDPIDRGEPTPTTKYDFGPSHVRGSLARVNSCDELLEYFRANSTQQIRAELEASQRYADQWGSDGGDGGDDTVSIAATDSAQFDDVSGPTASDAGATGAEAAPEASRSSAGVDEANMADGDSGSDNGSDTGTNNQEAGVDEADMIKTDGRRVVSIRGSEVIVVDLGEGGTATVSGRVALPGDNAQPVSMFLHDDRVMVLGSEWRATSVASNGNAGTADPGTAVDPGTVVDPGFDPGSDAVSAPATRERSADSTIAYGASFVTITEISLAGAPTIVDTREIEGSLVDGRMVDGTVRVVVTTTPQLPEPFVDTSGAAEQDWREWDRRYAEARIAAVEETTIADWLPKDGDGEPVTGCEDTYLPEDFGGPQSLSVLTFSEGAASMQSTSVVAGGASVYASPERLYVSTSAWTASLARTADIAIAPDDGGSMVTDIHAFDIAGTANATYVASGRVEGTVLNQYSMSEADGVLRVALTTGNWNAGESGIVTLRPEGRELAKVGEVWGLGPGETIRSVRYIGNTAYVVTFRQTDPFYVVDVADPAAPKVLGELKVPGFSSYLHPVGDSLVLGVGSDATDEGRITGSKISLYDVSNPANPTELDTWVTQDMEFSVAHDPHSFTWDSERSIAYVTYTNACFDTNRNCLWDGNGGALAIAVRNDELVELTRLTHDNRTPVAAPPTVPENTVPETTVPEPTVPETTVPETTVPETTVPKTTVPETTVPDVAIPVIVEPSLPVEPGYPDEWKMPITRAFPLGDRVVTWSFWGVGIFAVDGYALTGFAAF